MYTFNEADFANIHLWDIEFMYHDFRDRTIRHPEIVFALDTIKRFIRRHIYHTYRYDFQLGIETNQKRINLLKTDMTHPLLEDIPLYTVVRELELGVVYENEHKKKQRIMRAAEIPKYSDGTLEDVRKTLQSKYEESEKKRLAENDHMPRLERIFIEVVISAIKNKVRFRQAIRRFEGYLGIRRTCMKKWTS
ncbi:hypothetical protein L6452_18195 [Arctium lappa]|uniref:Uncharacterized protein n=1 Tax=Arctium lappa TaxID=4217 RepID=A0ACB9C5P3_ARCLA|nr:hypothetical protein L6452_18195 [Arctium lappa]